LVRSTKFEIAQSEHGGATVLSVTGELDMNTIDVLSERVQQQLDAGAMELVIDFTELAFMDSSGLRLLIALHDRAREEAWRLRLRAPRDEAARMVLNATGADQRLPFEGEHR
jgi:anti-sigma B factor antagonist